jgi:DNA polymerase (family 10)
VRDTAPEELVALTDPRRRVATKIAELAATGNCELLDQPRCEMPASVAELLRIPGLGPSRVRALHNALGVPTIVQARCRAKREQHIFEAPAARLHRDQRLSLAAAQPVVTHLVRPVRAHECEQPTHAPVRRHRVMFAALPRDIDLGALDRQ